MRLQLHLQNVSTCPGLPPKAALRAWAAAALSDLAQPSVELGIRVVDAPESAALNQRYRGKSGPTNVLSFSSAPPASVPEVTDCFLGDLVICAAVVQNEAEAQRKPLEAHWAHMVVHGILHLRGYDHTTDHDAYIMEALEANVLERLGFPNPYSD